MLRQPFRPQTGSNTRLQKVKLQRASLLVLLFVAPMQQLSGDII